MRLPLLLTLLFALAACRFGQTHSSVSIADAMIRLPAVPGRPAAGYAAVAATKDRGALIGVSSSRAARVEMHETVRSGSGMAMRKVDRISFAEAPEIVFAPGGRHLMLIDLDPALKPGDRADLTFRFANGDPITASARVIGAGDDVPQ